jgi:hypothetical protein
VFKLLLGSDGFVSSVFVGSFAGAAPSTSGLDRQHANAASTVGKPERLQAKHP